MVDIQLVGLGAGASRTDHGVVHTQTKRDNNERSARHCVRAFVARNTRTSIRIGIVGIESARYDRNGKINGSEFQRNTLLAGNKRNGVKGERYGTHADPRKVASRLSTRTKVRYGEQVSGGNGSRLFDQRVGGMERKVVHEKRISGACLGRSLIRTILVARTILHDGEYGPGPHYRRRSKGHQAAKLARLCCRRLLHRK